MLIILEIIGGVFLLGALLYGISNFLARLELKKVTIDNSDSVANFNNRVDSNTATTDMKKDVE